MSAPAFDPQAIARRVFEREHAAVDEPHEPAPARPHDPYLPGTGQTRGRPLPTVVDGDGSDIFDRLERQREAKRIRSPFVLRDVPFEPTARTRAQRAAADERFAAPPLVQDESWDIAVDKGADNEEPRSASSQVSESTAALVTDRDRGKSRDNTCPVERCGDVLTGGGAPRGWVLVRVIGSGAPRRYCSAACAVAALARPPQSVRESAPDPALTAPRRVGRPIGKVAEHLDEIVRRYQAGETSVTIGRDLGHTPKTVRDALDRAGIQRRDDRTTRSGGANRIEAYPDELVARVRGLYVVHGRTQREVAEALGITTKVVQSVMERHDIPARPAAHIAGRVPRAAPELAPAEAERRRKLREAALARPPLPYVAAQVRAWCRDQGIDCPTRGRFLPRPIVDAYLAAHQNGAST